MSFLSDAWDDAKSVAKTAVNTASSVVNTVVNTAENAASTVGGAVEQGASSIWTAVAGVAGGAEKDFTQMTGNIGHGLAQMTSYAWNDASRVAKTFADVGSAMASAMHGVSFSDLPPHMLESAQSAIAGHAGGHDASIDSVVTHHVPFIEHVAEHFGLPAFLHSEYHLH